MHIFKRVLSVIFVLFISTFFVACGYKPSSYYAKQEMEGNVFIRLDVSLEDPKNSVLVKDAVNKILMQKLDSKLVNNEKNADVIMNLAISRAKIITLQYDRSGYNKLYKALVDVKVDYFRKDNKVKKSFMVDGEYDFSVDDGSTITETKRYDAITNASNNAVEEILSRIAVASFR